MSRGGILKRTRWRGGGPRLTRCDKDIWDVILEDSSTHLAIYDCGLLFA